MVRLLIAVIFMPLLLLGCSKRSHDMGHLDHTHVPSMRPQVERELALDARSIDHSLSKLAALKAVDAPKIIVHDDINLLREGFDRLVSLDWDGPIYSIMKKIAELSNYRLKVVGVEPAIPVFLSINRDHISLKDLLQEVRNVSESQAEITVDVGQRLLVLRYYPM